MQQKENKQSAEWIWEEESEKWDPSPLLVSICFHLLLFLAILCFVIYMPVPGNPLGGRSADSVGIVFSTGNGFEEPGGGSVSFSQAAKPDLEKSDPELNEKEKDQVRKAVDSFLPAPNTVGVRNTAPAETEDPTGKERENSSASGSGDSGNSSPFAGQSGSGNGSGNGAGNGGQAVQFADLKGNGRKFVYVLDRSESMRWSNEAPMKFALKEAKESINSLDARLGAVRFQLIYYNHEAKVFEKERLLPVDEPNKNRAIKFLDSIYPEGGTNPLAAIEKAVKLNPDVIFFLTDADEEIPPMALDRIHDLCRRSGVRQIHVVEFGKESGVKKISFKRLALENNGQYIFKKID
ncbi:MAG: VWA domain-containing protein [Planctomycetia bacterium]|nr:VWA domain-containing protein [Planctomycetia bacterium]